MTSRTEPAWRFGLVLVSTVLSAGALRPVSLHGQEAQWYPSRWGAEDQRGAANRLTPAKTLEAKNLITRGTIYQLGRVYEPGMPMYGSRHFSLRIPQAFVLEGANSPVFQEEMVSGQLGQIGTQFDGLGHFGIGDLFYNGNDRHDFAQPEGLTKLGIENVGPIFTRGVLIDVAAYKGVSQLEPSYEITAADLQGALAREGVEIRDGDVVLINTGWGSLWMRDNAKYAATCPGLGLEAAQFLVDRGVVVVGADQWGIDVSPNPDPAVGGVVHQLLLAKNGIYQHENLDLSALARDTVYEFAYIFNPLALKGATGSPGGPIAVR